MTTQTPMTIKHKSSIINAIVSTLRLNAETQNKFFDASATWLALALKDDDDVCKIAHLLNIDTRNSKEASS